jgi:septum site-determining protein MinC
MISNAQIPIQIKADRDGFVLSPDPSARLEAILEHLRKKLKETSDFFSGARMALDLRERPFRPDEIIAIRGVLEETAGVKLVEVRVGEDRSFIFSWISQQLGLVVREMGNGRTMKEPKPQPVIVRSTCRSGARVESPADCVILGDVNPGAEVLAAGDIVIFGRLRGTAHAGALGDRLARIWALAIEPNQIRIADLVAMPPKGDKTVSKRFEIAEIRGDRITVTTA